MQKIIVILVFYSFIGCSPKIKTITEYQRIGNDFVPSRITEFDRIGNKIKEEGLGNSRSNRIITTEFRNGKRIFELKCDYFKSHDTCVTRSFSKFEYDINSGIEKQTLFESDSLIRFIRETRRLKNIEIIKSYSWEFYPSKNPKMENALILTDTTYFDKKDRKIKRIHYNSKFKEPSVELYEYYKNGYSQQTIGTARDTILKFSLSKLQKMANKKKIDYTFYNFEDVKYEIENY